MGHLTNHPCRLSIQIPAEGANLHFLGQLLVWPNLLLVKASPDLDPVTLAQAVLAERDSLDPDLKDATVHIDPINHNPAPQDQERP